MRVAAAQVRCPWLDTEACVAKIVEYLGLAGDAGAELVAFPEAFLAGYPIWLTLTDGARFDDAAQKAAYAAYLDAAVELGGRELREITDAVRDVGVFTYLGITERSRGTVYCTLVALDPVRGLVGAHRKLMPTFEERLVWGTGDGHGLRAHDVAGLRVSGLSCWENWMPLARHALYADGTQLHVSTWPGSSRLTGDITRFVAIEGRVYSLAVGALIDYADVPADFPLRQAILDAGTPSSYDGGSAIAGPDGRWIVEPVCGQERLLVADLDPAAVRAERQNFDAAGHYGRPDVFRLAVDRRRLAPATFLDDAPTTG
ncbi:carbon-nitrogen hydrolase family protein [Solihabitans fulvus]|uniref:Carbon-nitrogen hydrolase family protein n=1 Tax=Solihabitans fulvus TaxID=1892852 RepID=A0A5B2WU14_9PSEU|nr:carbon-nitrogen hydrolase family protein [Solihabitans fulvus]KAA2254026.1 carbon-nitrogen hydrolase family protein [Solihabitans fulvus]